MQTCGSAMQFCCRRRQPVSADIRYDDEDSRPEPLLPAKAGGEILQFCIDAGGSITGEHGVGADKAEYMPRMLSADDLRCGCSPGDARSIPVGSAILERCFRRRVSAAKFPAPTARTRSRRRAWASGSDD